MPYREFAEKWWRCSWGCGFKHYEAAKVAEHEIEKHDSIGKIKEDSVEGVRRE